VIPSVDDPLVWGLLPYRFLSNPDNMRWSLGSHDICFKNGYAATITITKSTDIPRSYSILSKFFFLGQTLPTHRSAHSTDGGPFQPTITQCIRLLSQGPYTTPTPSHPNWPTSIDKETKHDSEITDPFSDTTLMYSTTGTDSFQAPSAYGTRRHSWVHIFPEGQVHQHPDRNMRYMKWGVARLILESEPCPTVIPMWIEGPQDVMHESRTFPRFLPRLGKTVNVTFGEPVSETVWAGFRERWRKLKKESFPAADVSGEKLDERLNEELMTGKEATDLRVEVAFAVREEISKLRLGRGWPDEDPKARLQDTYRKEGPKREGKMEDGSWVKDT